MNDLSYKDWNSLSDLALSKSIGAFVKHHRMRQHKTQNEIASNAGISRSTLSLLERGEAVTLATLIKTLRTLDLLYVMDIFKTQEQISPIELAKIDQKKRKRVRSKGSSLNDKSDW